MSPELLLPRFQSASTLPEHPLNTSDHLPLVASIQLYCSLPVLSEPEVRRKPGFIPRSWSRISKQDIHSLYTQPLHLPLLSIHNPSLQTTSPTYSLIDKHLSDLTDLLLATSKNIPPKVYQHFKKPGWRPILKAAKRSSKELYHLWMNAGKPRDPTHPARAAYKAAKRDYRQQIRLQKKLADEDFYNSLDQELDPHRFFQAIRCHTSPSTLQPPTNRISVNETTFEGSTILEGWAQYFENLGASSIPPAEDLACRLEIFQLFQSLPDVEPDLICAVEVGTLISSLPKGKAAGPDYLSNEHLIFSHTLIANTLETLFNVILISGHIPSIFHQGLIVPIPKKEEF